MRANKGPISLYGKLGIGCPLYSLNKSIKMLLEQATKNSGVGYEPQILFGRRFHIALDYCYTR